MESKIMQVFYGNDCLPYKDKARSVHYPIIGQAFEGASATTEIRFYVKDIGGVDTTKWIANTKLPSGKKGYKLLDSAYDSVVQERYVVLQLDQFYTQEKGDVYISLNGYDGGITLEQDENDNYILEGTPIIQATGSIKITMQYAVQINQSDIQEYIDLDDILAYITGKADVSFVKSNFIPKLYIDREQDDYYDKAIKNYITPLVANGFNLNINGSPLIIGLELIDSGEGTGETYIISFISKGDGANADIQLLRVSDKLYATFTEFDLNEPFETLIVGITTSNSSHLATDIDIERLDSLVSGKLDKSTTSGTFVYTHNGSTQSEVAYSKTATSDNIVQRNGTQIKVPTQPVAVDDATSRAYVDNGLNGKQAKLISGTNIKTINGNNLLGGGDLVIDAGRVNWGNIQGNMSNQTDLTNALNSKESTSNKTLNITNSSTNTQYPSAKAVYDLVSDVKKNAYKSVNTTTYPTLNDFLESTGEEGYLYLYPVDTSDLSKGYKQYIWENNAWLYMGDTNLDLSPYPTLAGNNTFTGSNTIANAVSLNFAGTYTGQIVNKENQFRFKYGGSDKLKISTANITASAHLIPNSGSTFDLGTSTYTWKDIYLSGNLYGNTIYLDNTTSTYITSYNGSLRMSSNTGDIISDCYFKPSANNALDLGASGVAWKDLYLAGNLSDGTNSMSVADISNGLFNVINASDITNNTLTQAQYDLITNGKPTLITGTYLGYKNMLITYWTEYATTWRALAISEATVFSVLLNTTTKVLELGGNDIHLKSISRFNNKDIPAYPTTNTNPQVLTIGANGGNLSWEDVSGRNTAEFTPTNVVFGRNPTSITITMDSADITDIATNKYDLITLKTSSGIGYDLTLTRQAELATYGSTIVIFYSSNFNVNGMFATFRIGFNSAGVIALQTLMLESGNNVFPYATNSGTVLDYETINNISTATDKTFTLATAPANTYPEYKANITNTDTTNAITITLPSGTKIITNDSNITISSNTFTIPADSSVELNLQNGHCIVYNWGI